MVAVALSAEQLAKLALPGRFSVEARIGSGAMGEVFRGYGAHGDQRLAIKFVRQELCKDPVFVARFVREAKALAMLVSPHIPRVVDYGVALRGERTLEFVADATARLAPDPQPGLLPKHAFLYLTMQWAEGPTLGDLIGKGAGLTGIQFAQVAYGLLDALGEAHRAGLVHRDVKPGNVIVGSRAGVLHPWLVDFGVVKSVDGELGDELTQGMVAGTPNYFSPEQARGEPVTFHVDLWALGVVGFYALSLRYPYEGAPVARLIVDIQRSPPKQLTAAMVQHAASPALLAWVNALLAWQKADRVADVALAREALLLCPEAEAIEVSVATMEILPTLRQPASLLRAAQVDTGNVGPSDSSQDGDHTLLLGLNTPDAPTLALPPQTRPHEEATRAMEPLVRAGEVHESAVAPPVQQVTLPRTWLLWAIVALAAAVAAAAFVAWGR